MKQRNHRRLWLTWRLLRGELAALAGLFVLSLLLRWVSAYGAAAALTGWMWPAAIAFCVTALAGWRCPDCGAPMSLFAAWGCARRGGSLFRCAKCGGEADLYAIVHRSRRS